MSNIKAEAIQRAINWLTVAGCKFHIVTQDGVTHGAPIVPERVKRPFVKVNNFNSELGYIASMKKLNPGDEFTWKLGDRAASFKKCLTGEAIRLWGSGSYVIQSNADGDVTILRME